MSMESDRLLQEIGLLHLQLSLANERILGLEELAARQREMIDSMAPSVEEVPGHGATTLSKFRPRARDELQVDAFTVDSPT